jgi:predicted DCC family thiol-disulfide oxidoreductase YuxK
MRYIVFYDGVCGLCNRSVRVLIKLDRQKILKFASLQSGFAKETLKGKELDIDSGTIVFLDNEKILVKSNAIIQILHSFGGIYRLVSLLYIIPLQWRDSIYDWISRNRYRWFGKYESCPMPGKDERDFFIDV